MREDVLKVQEWYRRLLLYHSVELLRLALGVFIVTVMHVSRDLRRHYQLGY